MKIVFAFIASGAVQINDIKVEKVFIIFLSGFQDILQPTTERTEETTSELDKVFQVIEILVKKKRFPKFKYFFAPYMIIKERYIPNLKPADFCKLLRERTDLPDSLLPKSYNIRSICYRKSKSYPNWELIGENPVFVEYVKDVAAEMLKLIKEL